MDIAFSGNATEEKSANAGMTFGFLDKDTDGDSTESAPVKTSSGMKFNFLADKSDERSSELDHEEMDTAGMSTPAHFLIYVIFAFAVILVTRDFMFSRKSLALE